MSTAYRVGATSINEIEPLAKSDGERVENGWALQRSIKVIEACRPAQTRDWPVPVLSVGVALGTLFLSVLILDFHLSPSMAWAWLLIRTPIYGICIAACVLLARNRSNRERNAALNAHTPEELAWHLRVVETSEMITRFDAKLKLLKQYEANAHGGAGIDAHTVMKCAAERAELDYRRRALAREEAIRKLKESGYYGMIELSVGRNLEDLELLARIPAPIGDGPRVAERAGDDTNSVRIRNDSSDDGTDPTAERHKAKNGR